MDVHCMSKGQKEGSKSSMVWYGWQRKSSVLWHLSWTMRLADFIWHLHSFWRKNLREKLNCLKLDGDRGHFPRKRRCSHFWTENIRLVRVESKYDTYKKELGNYTGYQLRKVYWKDLHYWGMEISRNVITHVLHGIAHKLKLTFRSIEYFIIVLVVVCVSSHLYQLPHHSGLCSPIWRARIKLQLALGSVSFPSAILKDSICEHHHCHQWYDYHNIGLFYTNIW